jgi:hypothetical protein
MMKAPIETQRAVVRAARRGLANLAAPERRERLLAELDAADARALAQRAARASRSRRTR